MKAEELKQRFTQVIEKIAGVNVNICFCHDGEYILQWDGTDRKPFEKMKNYGLKVYGFETDNESGFNFAGCMLSMN